MRLRHSTGSSTLPVVPESGARATRASGPAAFRPRPVTRDLHHTRTIARVVAVERPPDRLMAHRPDGPAVEIAQVDEDAVGVFRPVRRPGGEREAVPRRVAGSGAGQEHRVAPVREETGV